MRSCKLFYFLGRTLQLKKLVKVCERRSQKSGKDNNIEEKSQHCMVVIPQMHIKHIATTFMCKLLNCVTLYLLPHKYMLLVVSESSLITWRLTAYILQQYLWCKSFPSWTASSINIRWAVVKLIMNDKKRGEQWMTKQSVGGQNSCWVDVLPFLRVISTFLHQILSKSVQLFSHEKVANRNQFLCYHLIGK